MASRRNKAPAERSSGRPKPKYEFVVSACLAGIKCTFKGKDNLNKEVAGLFKSSKALAVCPETAGGLGVPRERSEIRCGGGIDVLDGRARVLSASGKDVTGQYVKGSLVLASMAKNLGIRRAILKSRSPACGIGGIYDGTFSGAIRKSDGVFAAALKREGFSIRREKADAHG